VVWRDDESGGPIGEGVGVHFSGMDQRLRSRNGIQAFALSFVTS
jgi:hypothetical protein